MKNRDKVLIGTAATMATVGLYFYFSRSSRKHRKDSSQFPLSFSDSDHRRSSILGKVDYKLELIFKPGESSYKGQVDIEFELAGSEGLELDFKGRRVELFEVNGKTVAPVVISGKIELNQKWLVVGSNRILVRFENDFDADGTGAIEGTRSSETGAKNWACLMLSPGEVSRVFPCFDQPDIRGVLRLRALLPETWACAANEKPLMQSQSRSEFFEINGFEGAKDVSFLATKKTPAHLFGFAAGEFSLKKGKKSYKGVYPEFLCGREIESRVGEVVEKLSGFVLEALEFLSGKFSRYPASKITFVIADSKAEGRAPGCVVIPERLFHKEGLSPELLLCVSRGLTAAWFGFAASLQTGQSLAFQEGFGLFVSLRLLEALGPKYSGLEDYGLFTLAKLGKETLEFCALEGSPAATGKGVCDALPPCLAEPLVANRAAWAMRHLAAKVGEGRVWEILKEFATGVTWEATDLEEILKGLNAFERGVLERILGEEGVPRVELRRGVEGLRPIIGSDTRGLDSASFVLVDRDASTPGKTTGRKAMDPSTLLCPPSKALLLNGDLSSFILPLYDSENIKALCETCGSFTDTEAFSALISLFACVRIGENAVSDFLSLASGLVRPSLYAEYTGLGSMVRRAVCELAADEVRAKFEPIFVEKLRGIGVEFAPGDSGLGEDQARALLSDPLSDLDKLQKSALYSSKATRLALAQAVSLSARTLLAKGGALKTAEVLYSVFEAVRTENSKKIELALKDLEKELAPVEPLRLLLANRTQLLTLANR